nr:interleukin-31 isoform X1 [Macaca nemestrina]
MANTSGSRSPHRSWPCSLSPWPLTQVLLAGPGASGVLGIISSHQEDSGSTAPRVGSAQLQGEPGWTGVCDACVHGIVLSPGPATSVLFLLCCLGGWLTSHTLPVHFLQPSDIQKIVEELQSLSKMLLKDVKEDKGVLVSQNYTLPCLTPDAQPPNIIHSPAIRAYLKTIRQLDNKSVIDEIIEHLDKLIFQDAPETNVSVPTDTHECKRFILTISQQFSECMDLALKSLTSGAQQATT